MPNNESYFEFDAKGNFRIVIGNAKSDWTMYQHIAQLEVDGNIYIGVSQFYGDPITFSIENNRLRAEIIYKLERIETKESREYDG